MSIFPDDQTEEIKKTRDAIKTMSDLSRGLVEIMDEGINGSLVDIDPEEWEAEYTSRFEFFILSVNSLVMEMVGADVVNQMATLIDEATDTE